MVFSGEDALENFLNPEFHVSPLVELPSSLNPYFDDGVRVFLKLQTFLPLWNVKSISARGMLNPVLNWDFLSGVNTIVENSSGNTAFSLAVLGRSLGIKNMRARVSNEITKGKLQLLQLFGVEPVVNKEQICPNPQDTKSGIYKAKIEWTQKGWYNPDQYHNPENPNIHYQLTGKQLWRQISSIDKDYNFQIFCAGLGTTGTFIGISKYLKEQKSNFLALGVVRKPNNPIPWPRTHHLLQQIGFDWQQHLDVLEEISSKQAYEMSLQLIRAGLVVWPSSGMALNGLFSHLARMKAEGNLKKRKNGIALSAVVICPDGPYVYLDEYFKYCDPQLFPKIANEELLLEKSPSWSQVWDSKWQILCREAFDLLYSPHPSNAAPYDLKLKSNVSLIDLRTPSEFEHVHLPWAICMPFDDTDLKDFIPYKNKKIVLFCAYGRKSAMLTKTLQEKWYDALGVEWGLVARSENNLPRIVAKNCPLA